MPPITLLPWSRWLASSSGWLSWQDAMGSLSPWLKLGAKGT